MTRNFSCDECKFRTSNKIETHINKSHMKSKSLSNYKANRIFAYVGTSPHQVKDSPELLMIEDTTLDKEVLEEVDDNVEASKVQPILTIEH